MNHHTEPHQIRRSDIYLAAWMAAEKALPPESWRLIESYDAQHRAWRDAGWPNPLPDELKAAEADVRADPLASIAFALREETNIAKSEEWKLRPRQYTLPEATPRFKPGDKVTCQGDAGVVVKAKCGGITTVRFTGRTVDGRYGRPGGSFDVLTKNLQHRT